MAMRILLVISLIVTIYLLLPSPGFPPPPPGSLESSEPADTESIYRRAYFTNLDRSEIMAYYKNIWRPVRILGPWRLNHPPEESAMLIRDQTRSSWLEELLFPLRESVYINGFYPTLPTEQINIEGVHYIGKITVRHTPSYPVARLTVWLMIIIISALLYREYAGRR